MRRLAIRPAVVLLLACACSAPDETHEAGRASAITAPPAAVLLHSDPWRGNGAPKLVVYADGTVLSPRERDEDGWPLTYRVSRVPASSAREALARFGIGDDFMRLDSAYDFNPRWSDQPTVIIHTWDGRRHRQVAVRGGFEWYGLSGRVPGPFREAFQKMERFAPRGARPWSPDTLDVNVWGYEHAADNPPLPWPAGWPDLRSPATRREPNVHVDSVYMIALPGTRHDELVALLRRQREMQAIGMNGRKWSVDYRLRLPGEAAWRSRPPVLEP